MLPRRSLCTITATQERQIHGMRTFNRHTSNCTDDDTLVNKRSAQRSDARQIEEVTTTIQVTLGSIDMDRHRLLLVCIAARFLLTVICFLSRVSGYRVEGAQIHDHVVRDEKK